jgi:flagellar biosynthesis regulator FlaF
MNGNLSMFRKLQYNYHRLGLDDMTANADRGRATITESLNLLMQAKQARSTSALPTLFTEIKKNELISIYSAGIDKEKQQVKELLNLINPSLSNDWNSIKTD